MSGSLIAPLFNIGPRISAQVLGLPYDQYRANSASNPTASARKIATIPVWVTADSKGMGNRPFVYAKPVAYAMLDPTVVAVGDYLIGGFGTFFIASVDGLMPTQIVRCNQTITVSRPGGEAIGAGYYGGAEGATLSPLMTAWPASVIQGTKGEVGEAKLPGDTRLAWVAVLLPAYAGVQILPGDWIATAQGTPMVYTISSCELTPLGWRLSAATAVG